MTKKLNLIKQNIIITYEIGKGISTFGDIEIEKNKFYTTIKVLLFQKM